MKAAAFSRALRDVVEGFAADGRDRGGRAEHDQHLLLAGAERDLFEGAFRHHIAALKRLLEAAAARDQQREGERGRAVAQACHPC